DRLARVVQGSGFQSFGNGSDVLVQAALGDKGARRNADDDHGDCRREEGVRCEHENETRCGSGREANGEGRDAGPAAAGEGVAGSVPAPVAPCYQSADPADRMADGAEQTAWIAAGGFDGESYKG